MDTGTLVTVLTAIYTASSYIGAALFSYMWRVTHLDWKWLRHDPSDALEPEEIDRAKSAARRNMIVAGVLTVTFALYSIAGTLGSIRAFNLYELPWEQGTVTTFLLVAANFLEMLIAVVLVWSRRQMNLNALRREASSNGPDQ